MQTGSLLEPLLTKTEIRTKAKTTEQRLGTPSGSLRFSMEAAWMKITGQRGLPVICRHNYVGPSANDVHSETYTWPKIWHKRSLEFIPTRDWREFNIFTAPEGETERKDVGIIFKCAPLFPMDSILTLE